MKNKYEQDEIILEKFKNEDQLVINSFYKDLWPPFSAFISKGCNLNTIDILDIYNKSFTTLYFNIKKRKLTPPLTASLKTYLFNIGKKHLYRFWKIAYRNKEIQTNEFEFLGEHLFDNSIDDYYDKIAKKDLVEKLLQQLDIPCRELLILSFVEDYSDEAIANKMGFPSQGAVRQKRFFCLKKIRKLLKNSKPDS